MARAGRTAGLFAAACFTVAGCAIGQPRVPTEPSPPARLSGAPPLEVRVGETDIAVAPGSTCWRQDNRSICADTIAPPELARTLSPAAVTPKASLHLSYQRPPIVGSLAVSRWKGQQPFPVKLTGEHAVIAPKKPGTYVYSVFARWPEGDATHVFRIQVKPGG